jgi:alkanesulfonate monooxygenase SsuD/methylene tetrahydromethanopterin reductase-like flavin-dependent oxidoreductase (luciferase family)
MLKNNQSNVDRKGRASFEGKYYTIKDAICNPKPIQKPHPLIMVGGLDESTCLR